MEHDGSNLACVLVRQSPAHSEHRNTLTPLSCVQKSHGRSPPEPGSVPQRRRSTQLFLNLAVHQNHLLTNKIIHPSPDLLSQKFRSKGCVREAGPHRGRGAPLFRPLIRPRGSAGGFCSSYPPPVPVEQLLCARPLGKPQ